MEMSSEKYKRRSKGVTVSSLKDVKLTNQKKNHLTSYLPESVVLIQATTFSFESLSIIALVELSF